MADDTDKNRDRQDDTSTPNATAPAPSPLAPQPSSPVAPSTTPAEAMSDLYKKRMEEKKQNQAEQDKLELDIAKLGEEEAKSESETSKQVQDLEMSRGIYKMPKYEPIPYKAPKPTSVPEQWGSVAMMFAMLGSMFTRNHAVTALTAATAAMNGFQQKDAAAAEQAYKEWKIASENALKAANYEQKAYEEAMKGMNRLKNSQSCAVPRNTIKLRQRLKH